MIAPPQAWFCLKVWMRRRRELAKNQRELRGRHSCAELLVGVRPQLISSRGIYFDSKPGLGPFSAVVVPISAAAWSLPFYLHSIERRRVPVSYSLPNHLSYSRWYVPFSRRAVKAVSTLLRRGLSAGKTMATGKVLNCRPTTLTKPDPWCAA